MHSFKLLLFGSKEISLIYSKTTYLLFNKHPYLSIKTKFTVVMNQKVLRSNDFVKYLGVYIGEKLTWSAHINKLVYNWLSTVQCCIKFVTM